MSYHRYLRVVHTENGPKLEGAHNPGGPWDRLPDSENKPFPSKKERRMRALFVALALLFGCFAVLCACAAVACVTQKIFSNAIFFGFCFSTFAVLGGGCFIASRSYE